VGLAVRALLDRVAPGDREPPAPRPPATPPEAGDPLKPEWVLHSLAGRLPAGAALTEEAPSTKRAVHAQVRVSAPNSYHTTASGGLGYAMPAAVGLKLASPERTVACVVGEGSAMYAIQALWTAVQEGAAVVFVVLDNGQYAILKAFGELLEVGDRVPGLEVGGLDLVRIAEGMGCRAERVERAAELPGALDRALAADAPVLLDVVVHRAVPSLV
jgi:benzoylformate decarboxylase